MSLITCDINPKNADTDLALQFQVTKSLQQCGYRDLRPLVVQITRGTASVQGQVSSFFLRQVAVECIKRHAGVTRIIDHIEVVYPPEDIRDKKCLVDETNNSTLSTEHRVGLTAIRRTSQDSFRSQNRHRRLLSSVSG